MCAWGSRTISGSTKGVYASNGTLVEKAVKIIELLGTAVATPGRGAGDAGIEGAEPEPWREIRTVGIAGTGLIGAGWAARLLFRGYNVVAYDVSPSAEAEAEGADQDGLALAGSSCSASPARRASSLSRTTSPKWRRKADFIHEAAPEREDLKIALFRDNRRCMRGPM